MYEFQPLGENSIRLLRIQPALRNGHIGCILSQYDDNIPPYDALSYYWGDPSPKRKIYVNNSLIHIHEALWEFLDQIQRTEETKTWIWTDFLCLNQENKTEMGQQVCRMGQVYSKAQRTISWLGCNKSSWVSYSDDFSMSSQDLEEDMRLIGEKVAAKGAAVKTFFAHPKLHRWTDFTKFILGTESPLDILTRSTPGHHKALPKAISEVMQLGLGFMTQRILNILFLPYWTRAWIVQEVALAKEVVLMFGRASLNFDDFILTYKSYCYYTSRTCGPSRVEMRVPVEARIAVHEKNVSFQQMMRWAMHCKASKTVDRIYGLLGLLQRCDDGIDTLPYILTQPIDYTRDWREVFWEIALTYRPITDPAIISGDENMNNMTRWAAVLYGLGKSLSCPFSRESLQYAYNERATPLCRNKAHVALRVVDICRQAVMINITIMLLLEEGVPAVYTSSWPTKPCARQLWFRPPVGSSCQPFQDIQLLLSTLVMETDEIQGMDENDKYQAAVIGMTMFAGERREGLWSCVPHQSILGPLEHKNEVRFECEITMPSSQLPCSSLVTKSSASSLGKPHQCRTLDRYLVIERTGWRLSLKELQYMRKDYWRGILNVEY